MRPLILLDFDGVLFNSAYEAYQVCENTARERNEYRKGVTFDEFMEFRGHLTDAWQFCRLYQSDRILNDFSTLRLIKPDDNDWIFNKRFFAQRAKMMMDENWAKLMSPFPFFYQLRPLMGKYPDTFKILSTRNVASIVRTLEYFEMTGIEVFGQEQIREYGSKLDVAIHMKWLDGSRYVAYIDDMNSHLEPFESAVDFCIHADWGYDKSQANSYTQGQAFQVLSGILRIAYE